MIEKREVDLFLKRLKQIIKIWDVFILDSRPKNSIKDLVSLGITANRRKEVILELELIDYCKGPLSETQFNGENMWVFGKIVKGVEIYIKLTIIEDTNKAICISFHKAEHPMNFPFKN
ncbi:type II toxin-antitoxin system MqsR family toxin [Gillisia sp. JM1]|uniref:type II toxin-antitoxin system MqsR family toxin n=1 Tax=Gillisia sp. JM1 TaxID=1283286 RepID=UPI0003F4EFE4|nr:type II toxin-antitoxin system MqsR family toxin [Gillisia sp. JM1]